MDFRKQQREYPPSTSTGHQWRRWKSYVSRRTHHGQTEMVHPHSVVKAAQQSLFNLMRLNKFGLAPKTLKLLQMHNREHPVELHHRLVRQLHDPQPQGSPEGDGVHTTHHRGQTTCPPGHLQHQMSQEGQKDHQGQQPPKPLPVHPTTIQKERSVQVHQSWDPSD